MTVLGFPFLEWLLNVSNRSVLFGATLMVQSTILIAAGLCAAYASLKSL